VSATSLQLLRTEPQVARRAEHLEQADDSAQADAARKIVEEVAAAVARVSSP